jgi:hypothetical protein
MFDIELFKQGYTALTRSGRKAHFVSTHNFKGKEEEMLVRVEDYLGFIPYRTDGTIEAQENPFDLVGIDYESKVIAAFLILDSAGNTKLLRVLPSKAELLRSGLVYPLTIKPLRESKSLTFQLGESDDT